MHALLHLRIVEALRFNLLTMGALPFLLVSYYRWTTQIWCLSPVRQRRPLPKAIWTLLGFIVLFWILRNVERFPFSLLSPSAVPI